MFFFIYERVICKRFYYIVAILLPSRWNLSAMEYLHTHTNKQGLCGLGWNTFLFAISICKWVGNQKHAFSWGTLSVTRYTFFLFFAPSHTKTSQRPSLQAKTPAIITPKNAATWPDRKKKKKQEKKKRITERFSWYKPIQGTRIHHHCGWRWWRPIHGWPWLKWSSHCRRRCKSTSFPSGVVHLSDESFASVSRPFGGGSPPPSRATWRWSRWWLSFSFEETWRSIRCVLGCRNPALRAPASPLLSFPCISITSFGRNSW